MPVDTVTITSTGTWSVPGHVPGSLADGNVTSVEQLTGLPIPESPEPDPVEALQAQVQAQQETIDALLAALGGDSE
jgi:hypothetical protein